MQTVNMQTFSELVATLQEHQDFALSVRTVRRRLSEVGLKGLKARKETLTFGVERET